MSVGLLIDAGNTRLKWQLSENCTCFAKGFVVHGGDLHAAVAQLSQDACASGKNELVEFIAVSSVLRGDKTKMLELALQEYFGTHIPVFVAKVKKQLLGLTCIYEDVSRFGVDRWLAILAAYSKNQKSVCVIDCGSALTVDVVNNAGMHMGGYILPGLRMSRAALLGKTDSVRFSLEEWPKETGLGKNSASAVQNGVLLQAQATIARVWEDCNLLEDFHSTSLVITGGDAEQICSGLDLGQELREDLVLEGLCLAYKASIEGN